MAEHDPLYDAFNDCVERLLAGEHLEDCLRRYPQYSVSLRPMLNSAEAVRRAQPSRAEATQAQMNARFRFEASLRAGTRRRGLPVPLRYAAAAAAVLIVISGALVIGSQSALPGETLYGVKRAAEQALMALAGEQDSAQVNERRIEEISLLLAAGRTADVRFEGVIDAQAGQDWRIAGLPVLVTSDTPGAADAATGDRVQIAGYTTPSQQLIASAITMLERGLAPTPSLQPSLLATFTPAPTFTSTSTSTLSPTPTLSATATPSATPTATPMLSATATPSATPTATQTPIPRTPSPTVCATAAAAGWVAYRVQPGDTLSGLAASTGTSLPEVLAANCLTSSSLLLAGQTLI
ncbi:MAG TPA: LysM peptidoglycan-binding domain-containing protein, partial [Candidatus Limnocylindrales bacterium]|nr:LysM peptidoglycan-binding domain-containing protein [Candidatus Limnocylindrales bacterium]